MANLKIGFIGCGGIANQKHFPGMAQQEGVELVAFCDIVPERAQNAAREYGAPGAKIYTDYRKMLEDRSIDAVHVLTPNVSHCEITCAALEAGKDVLCEKPMAATAADAKKMLKARDRSGKLLTIGYQYRHFHDNYIAKKVIDAGLLGDIYYAEASLIRRRGVPTWGVFPNRELQGGGPLIDIATHVLDLTLWMMDNYEVDYVTGATFSRLGTLLKPEEQGQVNRMGEPDPWNPDTYQVEDSAFGFIKMKNGALINLKASWALNMEVKPGMVLLCGTKGGLDTYDGVRLNHVIAGEQAVTMVGPKVANVIPGFSDGKAKRSKEAEFWVKALRTGNAEDLFVKAEQAYVVTRILDDIYKADASGSPVYFDE